ncbi:HSP20-like chaperone [Hygrophoropsis aurantiaca]|uniref:HSP20-like chaperone n=1 Tax=Hygrophoropsis aurantiaca TaxID=72124 RepID=A0ACB8ABS5_9AGAM|nr:HSP20-like chaperone [Hygrophoropsis aurantiaca]
MTSATTSALTHKTSHKASREQQFHDMDRALAKKYVEALLWRAQTLRVQRHGVIFTPRMELYDDPESSRITATLELPGLKTGDVSVHLDDDHLVISGDRRSSIPTDDDGAAKYPIKEIKYGKFLRKLNVPSGTMMSTISASMSEGMLVISWPRTPPGGTTRAAQ